MEATAQNAHERRVTNAWNVTLFSSPSAAGFEGRPGWFAAAEFDGREEFSLSFHEPGKESLHWPVLRELTLKAKERDTDLFFICGSAHRFSVDYSAGYLDACIRAAEKNGADILLGAVNWFESAVQVDENLFWVDKFQGMQFVAFFRRFYDTILRVGTEHHKRPAEHLLSSVAANKLLLYPFVSGVTERTSGPAQGRFYADPADQLDLLQQVKKFYSLTRLNK
ncbi:hypothetical protein EGT74_01555 [Chitinophaga lutea]|uniref:Uncharacterized protein n=1 Tax=Chitinophaga lutea TaxID=2488634 RepID=A0A3N4PZD6_9BACT|nr:hypothetical protein [Chitinophaga lutea]RPE12269.1 hypothetical protein EGT74_01555 [Chitinophaga lutea]